MLPVSRDARVTSGPSSRILELSRPKASRTVWATTPCEKLSWGNQEPTWPVSMAALRAVPSARIQYLARHKGAFSPWEDSGRKEEEEEVEASSSRKTQRASFKASQYENIVHLSTLKTRSVVSQEAGPPHAPRCPNWLVRPGAKAARPLQTSGPEPNPPHVQGDGQRVASVVPRVSQRLFQLSLPKVKQSGSSRELGRPEESIWTVSTAARRASASARVQLLARPKQLSKGYAPPREPEWRPTSSQVHASVRLPSPPSRR